MAEVRVVVEGELEFNPRQWLRREVLWASLMSPYSVQLEDWLNEDGNRLDEHMGNLNRQRIYSSDPSPEAKSLEFFTEGKNISGLMSAVVIFDSLIHTTRRAEDILATQASNIDRVLEAAIEDPLQAPLDDEGVFSKCSRLVQLALTDNEAKYGRKQRLLVARSLMTQLAITYTGDWILKALNDGDETLPLLDIMDGGTSRSLSPRVERLRPVFNSIIESEEYVALN